MSAPTDRGIAQFFFEVGYGACWAEAFIRKDSPPFHLTDAVVDRAWQMAPDGYDGDEFEPNKALADAAPELLRVLELMNAEYDWPLARAAIAKATGGMVAPGCGK